MSFTYDICIVGGGGHVGLPLGLAFAEAGKRVVLFDRNPEVLETIRSGRMPFIEYDAAPVLERLSGRRLFTSTDFDPVTSSRYVVIAVGTPVDEYLNPSLRSLLELMSDLRPSLSTEQTIIVRSTVYPRTCRQILARLSADGSGPWRIAYCPERIAQGYAIRELKSLPQLVSGLTHEACEDAAELFSCIAPKVIRVSVEEAELAKLFTNAWRYVQFALANQFYMMATSFDVEYDAVRRAITDGYGRAWGLPSAGFAAGPCLLKDTMQLAAFNSSFVLGHAAMMVNEGLPGFLVEQLRRVFHLGGLKVGILGMAFKADIDDTRDSLSYKLGKILRFHGAHVLYSDEFASDPTFVSKEHLIQEASVVVVGVPHSAYRQLVVPLDKHVVDLWGVLSKPAKPEGS